VNIQKYTQNEPATTTLTFHCKEDLLLVIKEFWNSLSGTRHSELKGGYIQMLKDIPS
jgi:hypothetical protein